MELWLWLFGQLVMGAALWGGIRADIKGIHRELGSLDRKITDQGRTMAERYEALESKFLEARLRTSNYNGLRERKRKENSLGG